MATYFHGNPEIQGPDGGLQTLVLMNPGYVQFSDAQPPPQPPPQPQPPQNNLVFLNSTAATTHAPQHFVGIPLPATGQDPADISHLHGLMPRLHYNFYNPIDQSPTARETSRARQGLSLSLSSQQKQGFGSQSQAPAVSGEDRSSGSNVTTNGVPGMQGVLLSSKYLKATQELLDEVVNVNGNVIKNELSKKVHKDNSSNKAVGESSSAAAGEGPSAGGEAGGKRAQDLTTAERQEIQMKKGKLMNMLDEVEQRYRQYHHQMQIVISSFEQAAGIGSANTYTALALQTISKQFRCLKDAITGQIRAASKSLGEEDSLGGKIEGSRLKFVDHHLRQQRALQQLGMIQHNAWRPQRGLPERSVSVLRAWLFEHFLHPYPKDSDKHMLAKQTGLSRSQVSNWFINARVRLWKPMVEEMYMEEIKDQEQRGSEDKTTKSEGNEDSTSKSVGAAPQEKGPATENLAKSFESLKQDNGANLAAGISMSPASLSSPVGGDVQNPSGFNLIGSSELDGITQGNRPKKPRTLRFDKEMLQSPNGIPLISMDAKPEGTDNDQLSMKFGNERQERDGFSFMGNQTNFICGIGQYPMGEFGRFDAEQFAPRFSGNGVSLTLGLPHCENLSLSASHQNFLPNQNIQLGRRVDLGETNDQFSAMNTSAPHSSAAYETINIQNRKGFAAQLLPDFVA